MTVSRVVVYRYECAGHDRFPTGLARRPPTQAPDNGSVKVDPYCADHSHFSAASVEDTLLCLASGTWLDDQSHCVCDEGYSNEEDAHTCKGKRTLTIVNYSLCVVIWHSGPTTSTVPGHRGTETGNNYTARQTSLPLSYTAQYLSPSSTPLAGGSTDRPTVAAEDSGGSGPLLPIVAGVCGFIVTILVLILVVVLIVALLRKNRKTGPEERCVCVCVCV